MSRKPWHLRGLAMCLGENLHYFTPATGTDATGSQCTGVITWRVPHFLRPATPVSVVYGRDCTEFPDKVASWFRNRTTVDCMEIERLANRPHWVKTKAKLKFCSGIRKFSSNDTSIFRCNVLSMKAVGPYNPPACRIHRHTDVNMAAVKPVATDSHSRWRHFFTRTYLRNVMLMPVIMATCYLRTDFVSFDALVPSS